MEVRHGWAATRGDADLVPERASLNLHLQQLAYLRAVARYGSLSRAAEALQVSQPALSQALAELERRLGVALFERAGRGRRPTAAGQEVIRFAEQTLLLAEDLRRRLQDYRGGEGGTLSVGMIDAASLYVLPDVVRRFREAHPAVELKLAVETSGELLHRLRAHALDLVFVVGPVDEPDLASTEVLRERLYMYMGRPSIPPSPFLPSSGERGRSAEAGSDADALRGGGGRTTRPYMEDGGTTSGAIKGDREAATTSQSLEERPYPAVGDRPSTGPAWGLGAPVSFDMRARGERRRLPMPGGWATSAVDAAPSSESSTADRPLSPLLGGKGEGGIEGLTWVLYPEGSRTRALIDRALAERGVRPVVTLESANPQVLRQMVAMGLGCSVLPAAIAESGPEAADLVRGPLLAERPLCLVRRRSSPPDPRVEAFLRLALGANGDSLISSVDDSRGGDGG